MKCSLVDFYCENHLTLTCFSPHFNNPFYVCIREFGVLLITLLVAQILNK